MVLGHVAVREGHGGGGSLGSGVMTRILTNSNPNQLHDINEHVAWSEQYGHGKAVDYHGHSSPHSQNHSAIHIRQRYKTGVPIYVSIQIIYGGKQPYDVVNKIV